MTVASKEGLVDSPKALIICIKPRQGLQVGGIVALAIIDEIEFLLKQLQPVGLIEKVIEYSRLSPRVPRNHE